MKRTDTKQHLSQSLSELRLAIEERRFQGIPGFLVEQRQLVEQLDFADQESQKLFEQAQELTRWALTFMQVQHARGEQALSSLLRAKRLNSSYAASARSIPVKFVNLEG